MTTEKVLIIKAESLNLPQRKYIRAANPEDFLPGDYSFISRHQAEKDPVYKQLIPYVTVVCAGFILTLERTTAQSEARLHGMLSLGVGGHINPEDEGPDLAQTISRAMARELAEEMWLEPDLPPLLAGFINDDSNAVGSVHLGIHYLLPVAVRPQVRETDKMRALWLQPSQLEALRPRLETWSQILLPSLANSLRRLKMNAPNKDTGARE